MTFIKFPLINGDLNLVCAFVSVVQWEDDDVGNEEILAPPRELKANPHLPAGRLRDGYLEG